MTRPECPVDVLIAKFFDDFRSIGEVEGTMRLKWILNSEQSSQMDEEQLTLLVTRVKNKTL